MDRFCIPVAPDAGAFLANLRRKGTPRRVHFMELFLDAEVKEAICKRFDLIGGISRDDPYFTEKREVAIQRFLGYDYVYLSTPLDMPRGSLVAPDTAELARAGGRSFVNEHRGPIATWKEFEKYPWPIPEVSRDRSLQWYEKNLPDDMCVLANTRSHFCEYLCFLMGYETLCYALFDQRDLVEAMHEKILGIARRIARDLLQFKCVKSLWGTDDMGFKTGLLMSPDDMRRFVIAGHEIVAEMAHQAGRLYLLHACGRLHDVREDLLNDVKIDAKHSFEDTIERVTDAKKEYGSRCALIGGMDVDFMCRSDEQTIRRRVRQTLDVCMNGGGYCLGTGNSVANYIPVDNYLAMLDEGRRYV